MQDESVEAFVEPRVRWRRSVWVASSLVVLTLVLGWVGWTQHSADLYLLGLLCMTASPIAGLVLCVRLVRDRRGSRRRRTLAWATGIVAMGLVIVPAGVILASPFFT